MKKDSSRKSKRKRRDKKAKERASKVVALRLCWMSFLLTAINKMMLAIVLAQNKAKKLIDIGVCRKNCDSSISKVQLKVSL